jgi:hypothetical protein
MIVRDLENRAGVPVIGTLDPELNSWQALSYKNNTLFANMSRLCSLIFSRSVVSNLK